MGYVCMYVCVCKYIYGILWKWKVTQSCLTLCNPMNCCLSDSSVHGIFQARILEWVTTPFSRGIFPTQGSNPDLLHYRQILYCLSQQGSPYGILLSHKKEWGNAIHSNLDEPRNHHTECSKPDRERQISYDIAYVELKRKRYEWPCLQNRHSQT